MVSILVTVLVSKVYVVWFALSEPLASCRESVEVAMFETIPIALKFFDSALGAGVRSVSALEMPQITADAVMMTATVRRTSVFHERFWKISLRVKKLGPDIEEEDIFVISKRGQQFVGRIDFLTNRILSRSRSGEDGQKQNLGLRLFLTHNFDDFLNTGSNPFRLLIAIMSEVIGADHDHHNLGMVAVEFPVHDPPEHLFGGFSADTQIKGLPRCKLCVAVLSFYWPTIRD